MDTRSVKKQIRKTNIKVFLIRWWAVGAVYFFIGWGTRLGSYTSMIDFILMLGIVIGLFNSLIVNPVLKSLYNVGRRKKYMELTIMENVSYRLQDVVLAIFITFLVYMVYQLINIGAIYLFGLSETQVFLPGEPILFGLFYGLIFLFLNNFYQSIIKRGNM